jgi:hypothetical protein
MSKFRWTAIPAQRSSEAKLKVKVWTVLGLLIVCSLAGLFSFFAWMGNSGKGSAVSTSGTPRASAFATSVASDWLAGRPYSVPTASGLEISTNQKSEPLPGVAQLTWTGFVASEENGRLLETNYFAVPGSPPRRLAITVELTGNGPLLVAAPALEPVRAATSGGDAFDRRSQTQLQATGDLTRVVTDWAVAYTSNDRQRLKELTGDPDPNRTYSGLGGMTATNVQVLSLVEGPVENTAIARVQLRLVEKGFTMPAEYDLLVSQWGTATPKVLAWGAAGAGPTLTIYLNAGNAISAATTTTKPGTASTSTTSTTAVGGR